MGKQKRYIICLISQPSKPSELIQILDKILSDYSYKASSQLDIKDICLISQPTEPSELIQILDRMSLDYSSPFSIKDIQIPNNINSTKNYIKNKPQLNEQKKKYYEGKYQKFFR